MKPRRWWRAIQILCLLAGFPASRAAEAETEKPYASVLWTAKYFSEQVEYINGIDPLPVVQKRTPLAGEGEKVVDIAKLFKSLGLELQEDEIVLFAEETRLLFFSGRQEIIDRFPSSLTGLPDTPVKDYVDGYGFTDTVIITVQTRRRTGGGKTALLSERSLTSRSGQYGLVEESHQGDVRQRLKAETGWSVDLMDIELEYSGEIGGKMHHYRGVVEYNGSTKEPVVFYTAEEPDGNSVIEWSVRVDRWLPELPDEFKSFFHRWPDRFAKMVDRSLRAPPGEETTDPPVSALYLLSPGHSYTERKAEVFLSEEAGIPGRFTLSFLNEMLQEDKNLRGHLPVKEGDRLWRLNRAGVLYARGGQALHERLMLLERLEHDRNRDQNQVRVVLEESNQNLSDTGNNATPAVRELRSWLASVSKNFKAGSGPENFQGSEIVEMEMTISRNLADFNISLENVPAGGQDKWTWRGLMRAPLTGIVSADADRVLRERKWTLRVEPVRSPAEMALRDPAKRAALLREIEGALAAAETR